MSARATTSIAGYDRVVDRRDMYAAMIAGALSGTAPQPAWMLEGLCRDYRDYNERMLSILEEWRTAAGGAL